MVLLTFLFMPRMLRGEYARAIYHLMSRGDRRKQIYYDDVDRQDCLKILAEACQETGFEVHADCLMPKHFQWEVSIFSTVTDWLPRRLPLSLVVIPRGKGYPWNGDRFHRSVSPTCDQTPLHSPFFTLGLALA